MRVLPTVAALLAYTDAIGAQGTTHRLTMAILGRETITDVFLVRKGNSATDNQFFR